MDATINLPLEPAVRLNLGQRVAQALREGIFRGQITPTQRFSEAQLARSLRVSRGPIRDALVQLEQEGLIHRPDGGGIVVRLLSTREMEEICSLRWALESLALQRALRQPGDAFLAEMAESIEETRLLRGPGQLAETDLRFHEALVRAADHSLLHESWLHLRPRLRLLLVQRNTSDAAVFQSTVDAHTALLDALRARDEIRALQLLEQQLDFQRTWYFHTFVREQSATPAASA